MVNYFFPFPNLPQFITAFHLLTLNSLLSPVTNSNCPSYALIDINKCPFRACPVGRGPQVASRPSLRMFYHHTLHPTRLFLQLTRKLPGQELHVNRQLSNFYFKYIFSLFIFHSCSLFFVIISLPITTYLAGEHKMRSCEHESVCFRY